MQYEVHQKCEKCDAINIRAATDPKDAYRIWMEKWFCEVHKEQPPVEQYGFDWE